MDIIGNIDITNIIVFTTILVSITSIIMLSAGSGKKVVDAIIKGLQIGAGATVIATGVNTGFGTTLKPSSWQRGFKSIIVQIILMKIMPVKNNHKVNIKYSQSSLFIFIMNYFNITSPDPFSQYVFAVITLSLIALLSFINISLYLLVIYSYNKYNVEDRWPILKTNSILKRIIIRYKQTTTFFIIIEFILGISSLMVLFTFSVLGFINMITP
jgi:hypothetical protein